MFVGKKALITGILFIGAALLTLIGYLFLASPPSYTVDTPFREGVVSFQKNSSLPIENVDENAGFCAPPGCGPGSLAARENIELELTDEQLTALVNTLKPKGLRISDIRVKIDSGKIILRAISHYLQAPGKITVVADLRLNHFYVEKVYIGGIKAPERTKSFIEANGSGLINKAFQENGIFVKNMRLEEGKFVFEASVPKGMVSVEGEVIKINQSPTQNDTNLKPTGNIRY